MSHIICISITSYIQIPLHVHTEVQSKLLISKFQAVKALRHSQANVDSGDAKFYLKECKLIVDWIQANPGLVFTNDHCVLIPANIL